MRPFLSKGKIEGWGGTAFDASCIFPFRKDEVDLPRSSICHLPKVLALAMAIALSRANQEAPLEESVQAPGCLKGSQEGNGKDRLAKREKNR